MEKIPKEAQNQERSDCTQESGSRFAQGSSSFALLRAVASLLVPCDWLPPSFVFTQSL